MVENSTKSLAGQVRTQIQNLKKNQRSSSVLQPYASDRSLGQASVQMPQS